MLVYWRLSLIASLPGRVQSVPNFFLQEDNLHLEWFGPVLQQIKLPLVESDKADLFSGGISSGSRARFYVMWLLTAMRDLKAFCRKIERIVNFWRRKFLGTRFRCKLHAHWTGQIEDKFSTGWIFVRLGDLLTEPVKRLNAKIEVKFLAGTAENLTSAIWTS